MMRSTLAFVFPGQGSQAQGMLSELAKQHPVIEQTFAEASEGAKAALWTLAQEGPQAQLQQTQWTQPVLLAAGVAIWRLWQQQGGPRPGWLAGHSLGEYTALVAAGVLSLVDGAHIVRLRGQLMQEAVPESLGAMVAVLGADEMQVSTICQQSCQNDIVVPANLNAPGQIVIGGHRTAVDRAVARLAEAGIRKVVPLPVSVPSHTPLMRPVAEKLGEALRQVTWSRPNIPVIHNVDAQVHDDVSNLRHALLAQLSAPVRWTASIQELSQQGVTRIGECGPGKVLTGLIKRIDPAIDGRALAQPAVLDQAVHDWQLAAPA